MLTFFAAIEQPYSAADIIMNDVGGVVDLICPDLSKEAASSSVYITNRGLAKIVGKN